VGLEEAYWIMVAAIVAGKLHRTTITGTLARRREETLLVEQ